MRKPLLLLLILLELPLVRAQTLAIQDYIIFVNGDSIQMDIFKVSSKKVWAKARPGVIITLTADKIVKLYSNRYKNYFESLYLKEKRGKRIMARIQAYEGEFAVYGFMSDPSKLIDLNTSTYIAGETSTFIWNDLHFRHISESHDRIHIACIAELENKFYFQCPGEMNALLAKLDPEFDFNSDRKQITWNDIMRKYKYNCEAKMRDKAAEKKEN